MDFLLEEDLKEIDMTNLPNHIAIIMDGNGRWATKRSLPRQLGHQEGMKRVVEIVECAKEIGIKHLTLYAFSTENWKRPKIEVDALMNLLILFIRNELDKIHRNDVKIKVLGDIRKLPNLAQKEVNRAIDKTIDNKSMVLNIALNYGGRQELVKATKAILIDVKKGIIDIDAINEDTISSYLYTKDQPDPDLIIRPSGELRLSNFLIYQSAYSEFYFSDILWPDFKKKDLYRAIIDFQSR
ncbi:MAG: isoprenyl transferase, partial [Tissierellia bacterium]|nr:isoprenyl transferase [Tissierellia bacterium]